MKFSDLVKIVAVGALVYGAYKLGEKKGQKSSLPYTPADEPMGDIQDAEVVQEKSESDFIQELIDSLRKKPNKTAKDKNTLELLEIKLRQLLKGL
jgi:hypothetical protein